MVEDIEQPDRAVRRDVEQNRSTRPVDAAATVSALLEADLARPGAGDYCIRRPQVTELMCPERHSHPFDRGGRGRPERDPCQEDGKAPDRQSCCSRNHD